MSGKLVVSLSGVTGSTLQDAVEFAADLDRRSVPLSLLVAPRTGGELLTRRSQVHEWVQRRRGRGDAVLLHGVEHTDPFGGWSPRLGRDWRRAEFAGLPAHEAGLRLLAGVAMFERLGLPADCFVPPRWDASAGTLTALRRNGFLLAADASGVRNLSTGEVTRSRVLGVGAGEVAEPLWCRAMTLGAERTARRHGLVRIAASVADLRRPLVRHALLEAIDLALRTDVRPGTYRDFAVSIPTQRRAAPPLPTRLLVG